MLHTLKRIIFTTDTLSMNESLNSPMINSIKIRPHQLSDYKAMWRVAEAVWADSHETDEMFKAKISKGSLIVVEVDSLVVGYLASFPWNTTLPNLSDTQPPNEDGILWWHIHDVAILPNYQGKGLAKALMNVGLSIGILRGFKKTMAISVSEGGKKLLETSGFHVSTSSLDLPSDYPIEAIIWEKNLTN